MNLVFFLIVVIVTLLLALPAAAVTKLLMRLLFGRIVWFWLLTLVSVASVAVATIGELLLDFGTWETLDDIYTTKGQQELAAGFALQIAMFTLLVPDVEMRFISPVKWAIVGVIVYAIWAVVIYLGNEYIDRSGLTFAGSSGSVRSI